MMGITSVWICNGQITRTFTTEDSVLIARYPRSVSISKYGKSGIYRGVPGKAGEAPAGQRTSPGHGSFHNMASSKTTSLPNAQEGGPPFSK